MQQGATAVGINRRASIPNLLEYDGPLGIAAGVLHRYLLTPSILSDRHNAFDLRTGGCGFQIRASWRVRKSSLFDA